MVDAIKEHKQKLKKASNERARKSAKSKMDMLVEDNGKLKNALKEWRAEEIRLNARIVELEEQLRDATKDCTPACKKARADRIKKASQPGSSEPPQAPTQVSTQVVSQSSPRVITKASPTQASTQVVPQSSPRVITKSSPRGDKFILRTTQVAPQGVPPK